ncbi:MAG: hypothetical protein NZO58_03195, partial [Gemmataceae bacterium]|nr:hypothetical protein [Gemmataceae bacterium]
MNCLEFREWLQRRLDGAASAGAEETGSLAAAHSAECAACRALDQAAARLVEGLAALPRPEPSPYLTTSIVAAVLEDRRRRQRRAQRRVAVTVALAASLLALMYTLWLAQPTPPARPNLSQPANPAPQANHAHVPPRLTRHAEQAREAVAALTERLADQTKTQAKVLLAMAPVVDLPPMTSLPSLQELETPLDPAAQSLRASTRTLVVGLA